MSELDPFIQCSVEQVKEILIGDYDQGTIFIRKADLVVRGYRDILSFEEDFLKKVFNEVSRLTGIEIEIIENMMDKRLQYIE